MDASYHTGALLVINDVPRDKDRLTRWLMGSKYRYAFVDSYEEAAALSEKRRFDAIVYAHEFSFPNSPDPR